MGNTIAIFDSDKRAVLQDLRVPISTLAIQLRQLAGIARYSHCVTAKTLHNQFFPQRGSERPKFDRSIISRIPDFSHH
ncbi:hypothetical protein, partial [Bradyrhizobium sp.]|uniref:hypothetical protein n=1 Tax=Bradyrhizobium sp. TaxID=376 RepID=UPI003C509B77